MRKFVNLIFIFFSILCALSFGAEPARITKITTEKISPTSIKLKWNYASPGFTFLIQRSENGGVPWLSISPNISYANNEFSFTDSNLDGTKRYSYRIRVRRNSNGEYSQYRAVAAYSLFTPTSAYAEIIPRNAFAVKLTWIGNTNSQFISDNFNVYRRDDGLFNATTETPVPTIFGSYESVTSTSGFTYLATVPITQSWYEDNAVLDGHTYSYIVTAVAPGIESAPTLLAAKTNVSSFFLSSTELCNSSSSNPLIWNIKDHGAVGDGTTNDYDALKGAAQTMKSQEGQGKILLFPSGNYKIANIKYGSYDCNTQCPKTCKTYKLGGRPKGADINYSNVSNIRIVGCPGAKITLQGDYEVVVGKYEPIVPFNFTNAKNIAIEGLELDGGARTLTRTIPILRPGEKEKENRGKGIRTSSVENLLIKDVVTHDFAMDGVYIGAGGSELNSPAAGLGDCDPIPSYDPNIACPNGTRGCALALNCPTFPIHIADKNVRLHNVYSHHNSRLALMVAQVQNLYVSGGTVLSDSARAYVDSSGNLLPQFPGLPPYAGLDIEPNFLTYEHVDKGNLQPCVNVPTSHIVLENTEIKNNPGRVFLAGQKGDALAPTGPVKGPRIQDVSIRFSNLVAADEQSAYDTSFALSVDKGKIEYSKLDMKKGIILLSHNTGDNFSMVPIEEYTSTEVANCEIISAGRIDAGYGRHPLIIRDNKITGTHPSNWMSSLPPPPENSPWWLGQQERLKYLIYVYGNPFAVLKNNTITVPMGLYNSQGTPTVLFSGRLATGNTYQTDLQTGRIGISYQGLDTSNSSVKNQTEVINEAFLNPSSFTNQPNQSCLWTRTQNRYQLDQPWFNGGSAWESFRVPPSPAHCITP